MVTGNGTSGDPYLLSSFEDLDLIGTDIYTLNKYYKLGANIDASPTADAEYNDGTGWLPRGDGTTKFTGGFNGNGFKISNLFINRSTTDNIGFFGVINTNNIISVNLFNCNIVGQNNVGGICGQATIPDVTTYNISYCSVTGTISGVSNIGGIGGYINTSGHYGDNIHITYCNVDVTITATTSNCGGIAGTGNYSFINNCTITANLICPSTAGGVVGKFIATSTIHGTSPIISNITLIDVSIESGIDTGSNIGSVAGIAGARTYITGITVNPENVNIVAGNSATSIGGIVGGSSGTNLQYCICTIDISGLDNIGGIVGQCSSASTIINNTYSGNIVGRNQVGGIIGYIHESNTSSNSVSGTITSTGTSFIGGVIGRGNRTGGYCTITNNTCTDLVISAPNANYVSGICGQLSNHWFYEYGSNIGAGNRCINVNITGLDYVGGILGGYVDTNVPITQALFSGIIIGRDYVGGIVGKASNSTTLCHSSGSISGRNNIGGIVGYNGSGTVQNCFSFSSVNGTDSIGGLIGQNIGQTIAYCYSAGYISGSTNAGGLCGKTTGTPTVTSSYWDIETSGKTNSALGVGKTTDEMKDENTFVGWNFVTIWNNATFEGTLEGIIPEIKCGSKLIQTDLGEIEIEGLNSIIKGGTKFNAPVGNTILSGIGAKIRMGIKINAPIGNITFEGLIPFLGFAGDIEIFNLYPKNISKKFTTFVKFKINVTDSSPFTIKKAEAKMNNETVPLTIIKNNEIINEGMIELDSRHLPSGNKKLDIDIITDSNSNQFRRYIKII
jgi:hypothetical protein